MRAKLEQLWVIFFILCRCSAVENVNDCLEWTKTSETLSLLSFVPLYMTYIEWIKKIKR